MIELKLSQGAKPGHGGVLPGAQGERRDRRDPRRADGRGLHLAVAPFGVLDADRDDAVHRASCASCRAASRPASSSASATVGVPGDLQGDAGDRHLSRLHRRRRQGGRHRRGAARVHRPYRHAAARGAVASCTTRWSASACASASSSAPPARSSPASTSRARWRSAPTGATRRAASCSRSAASSRRAATPTAARPAWRPRTRTARRALVVAGQGRARRQLPQGHAACAGRADRGGGPRPSQRVPAGPHLAPPVAAARSRPSPSCIRPCASASCWTAPTIRAG